MSSACMLILFRPIAQYRNDATQCKRNRGRFAQSKCASKRRVQQLQLGRGVRRADDRRARCSYTRKHFSYTCHQLGSGSVIVQLPQPYLVQNMRLLLWDIDDRRYSFNIDVSSDFVHWTRVVQAIELR